MFWSFPKTSEIYKIFKALSGFLGMNSVTLSKCHQLICSYWTIYMLLCNEIKIIYWIERWNQTQIINVKPGINYYYRKSIRKCIMQYYWIWFTDPLLVL